MANLGQSFNVNALGATGNSQETFKPMPDGWYTVRISEAELLPTRNQTGTYIKLRLTVLGPTHQGRVVFSNLNIRNQNPRAQEIGLQQLGDVLRAVGLESIDNTDQLLRGLLSVRLGTRPAQDGYEAQNEVKAYKKAENIPAGVTGIPKPQPVQQMPVASTQMHTPAQQTFASGRSAGTATPPWVKTQA